MGRRHDPWVVTDHPGRLGGGCLVRRLPAHARHSPRKSAVVAPVDAKHPGTQNTPVLTIAGHHGGVYKSGDVLLSHRVPPAVPSALSSLASGFGMEPGVSRSPWSP